MLLEELEDEVLEEPLVPVPVAAAVAAFVTVPVPAVPASLKRAEQVLLTELDTTLAFPPKLQAVEALF